MSEVPAYNSAGLQPLVLAVIVVADMGTVEVARTPHSTQEEAAGSPRAGIRDMVSLSP